MAFLLDIFTYPSNKRVIYSSELNLSNRELLFIAYILKFTLVTLFDKCGLWFYQVSYVTSL